MIKEITLVNFRNHIYFHRVIDSKCVLITGENGTGKSSIIEAISMLMPGRGIRANLFEEIVHDRKLRDDSFNDISPESRNIITNSHDSGYIPEGNQEMNQNKSWATKLSISNNDDMEDDYCIKCTYLTEKKKKEFSYFDNNNNIISTIGKENHPNIFWLTPEIERLFFSISNEKRQFFSRIVQGIYQQHAKEHVSYNYYLRSRLRILKEPKKDNKLDTWLNIIERKISELGVIITLQRIKVAYILNKLLVNDDYVLTKIDNTGLFEDAILQNVELDDEMLDFIDKIYCDDKIKYGNDKRTAISSINQTEKRNIEFVEKCISHVQAIMLDNRKIDSIKHVTTLNATKFNVVLHHIKGNIDSKCSTGEQKSLIINLVAIYIESLQKIRKDKSLILLLDDFFAHLDDYRKVFLFKYINLEKIQTWITTTDTKIYETIEKELDCRLQNIAI